MAVGFIARRGNTVPAQLMVNDYLIGLSPLAREHEDAGTGRSTRPDRFIPAGAGTQRITTYCNRCSCGLSPAGARGFTPEQRAKSMTLAVYPRWRGERLSVGIPHGRPVYPRWRGEHGRRLARIPGNRFYPRWRGNTLNVYHCFT
ncbi:hypothetical protein KCP69_08050 [Salmonella enterica subsp. enterica]|nr:hypothetical protein KCP69_08050 [Salmonella enterica subsp. enterica]